VPSDVIGSLAPEATPTPVPTPTPTATPTLAPGQTPKPTPKPTPPPANLTVYLQVNPPDDGGLYTTGDAGLWTIHVTNKSTGASIASFQASSSGHTVHVPAGVTYTVSATGVGGYAESNGTDCSRKATSAVSYQCTVTEDDVPAGVWVNLSNPDGGDTSSLKVQLDATGASPAGPIGFTSGRAKFTLDAHVPWSIIVTGVPDGFSASDTCSGSSLSNGQLRSCTLTLTPLSSSAGAALTAAASGPNAAFVALPILATVPLRRRRQERDDAVR